MRLEGWKGGKSPTAPPLVAISLIVFPSEQKNQVIGFYGHRDSL